LHRANNEVFQSQVCAWIFPQVLTHSLFFSLLAAYFKGSAGLLPVGDNKQTPRLLPGEHLFAQGFTKLSE